MAKSIKILLVVAIILILAFAVTVISVLIATKDVHLDRQKLDLAQYTVSIYDGDGNRLENASLYGGRTAVSTSELHDYTLNAFIASEDREFYSHNGINYKRILKALYRNITSMKFKEGASTISQQLIKNTHLSGEKTIKRKLKEIKLTRELEKHYTKDEILGMYLNTIYFGHSCYGIDSAARFYFGIPAKDLNLNQSAILAGLLSSPNNYSPFKDEEKCIKRRNIVLKSMLECAFITEYEYQETLQKGTETHRNTAGGNCSEYVSMVFEELEKIIPDPYEIMQGYKIYTYLDESLQSKLQALQFDSDHAVVVRGINGGIEAYSSSVGQIKRQIASTAKPIFVYAPAIEEKKLHLFSKIDDSAVNYGGYTPENYDKKFHGKVTAEDSIVYSYNIPAVKTLNAVTVETAAKYAAKMGIELTKEDMNLALALGGLKSGMTLKELCDAYSVFQNGGKFAQSSFIKRIEDDKGNVVYNANNQQTEVFSSGTCSLINQALYETTKRGTGKRLKNLGYETATKTGTCGNENGNTDAYSVSYTSDRLIGVWLGDRNNNRLEVTGGNDCCEIAATLFSEIYKENAPIPLEKRAGTSEILIDRRKYENDGQIIIADDNSPKLNTLAVRCLDSNIPLVKSSEFTTPKIQQPEIIVDNNSVKIVLCQTYYYDYCVYRQSNNEKKLIYQGKWQKNICDNPPPGSYLYSVIARYDSGTTLFKGDEVFLPRVIISDNFVPPLPDIVTKDWDKQ